MPKSRQGDANDGRTLICLHFSTVRRVSIMVMLDRRYVDEWSLWLDFSIMVKMIFVVFERKGAY